MTHQLSERSRQILADPTKRPSWIIFELGLRGLNLANIGRELGVSRTTIYRVWEIRYPKMQAAIAEALGMLPQDLFPERYDENGLPLKFQNSTRPQRSNVRKQTKNYQEAESQAA